MPAPSDRKSHPPVGPEHYAPRILGTIKNRAVMNVARAAGIDVAHARSIVSTRMPDHLS